MKFKDLWINTNQIISILIVGALNQSKCTRDDLDCGTQMVEHVMEQKEPRGQTAPGPKLV